MHGKNIYLRFIDDEKAFDRKTKTMLVSKDVTLTKVSLEIDGDIS